MIQNEFEHVEGAVAIATCKRDACLVVHSLYHGVSVLALGTEVVEQEILMFAQHDRGTDKS